MIVCHGCINKHQSTFMGPLKIDKNSVENCPLWIKGVLK